MGFRSPLFLLGLSAPTGAAPSTPAPSLGYWEEVHPRRKKPKAAPTLDQQIREAIRRVERAQLEAQPVSLPQPAAVAAEVPAPHIEPALPAPLSKSQRARLVATLASVPAPTLLAYGLENAVMVALRRMREQEEEVLIIVLAGAI